jgi:hypothetical protein
MGILEGDFFKPYGQSSLPSQRKAVTQAHIIRLNAEDSRRQRLVGAVAPIGFREAAV